MSYRYADDGRYLAGIPARNITQDEWAAIEAEVGAERLQQALDLGLYKPTGASVSSKSKGDDAPKATEKSEPGAPVVTDAGRGG